MKFLLAVLILASLAGAVYAADQPDAAAIQPTVGITNDGTPANTADAAKPETTPATDGSVAAKTPKKPTIFALTVGLYSPTNGAVKTAFGSGYTRLGIRPLPTNAPHDWRFAFDVNFISMSSINGDATLIPLTAGFLRRFGKNDVKSYAALNVGPYYGTASVPAWGIDKHGFGWDANVTFGTVFKERYCIEARYDLMSKFAGLDFSSLSLSVAMKIFTAKL